MCAGEKSEGVGRWLNMAARLATEWLRGTGTDMWGGTARACRAGRIGKMAEGLLRNVRVRVFDALL